MLTSGAFGFLSDYLLWVILYASLIIHTWCFFRFFPKERRPRTRLVLGNFLVFVCILGTIGVAAETWLRFLSVKTDAFGLSWAAQRWFLLNTNMNSLHYRDEEWTREKPPGGRRIAFVGDSFVYGWGVERAEDRFPERVEAKLNAEKNGRYEVLNVAKPGWGTGDQIGPIHQMIEQFGVDQIVLCYMPNDIEKLLPRTAEFDPVLPPESMSLNTSTSALLDYLWWRVYVPYVPSVRGYHDWLAEGYADQRIWRQQQDRLMAIIQLCRARSVPIRVALIPYIMTGGEKYVPARVHAQVKQFLEANGVEVVDLLPVLAGRDPKTLIVNRNDPHPNEEAHRLFAEAIWQGFYEN